ncbi:MAG: alpha/beta hydrolase, partial [Rikenellaceae bacterium]
DLPGSGFSDWGSREVIELEFMGDVLADVMAKSGVSSACVVGHSMGGYVALAFAKKYPQLVSHLVLLHSSAYGDSPEKVVNREREIELVAAGKKEMLARVNPGRGFSSANVKKFEEVIEGLYDQVMMTEDEAIIATLRGMMNRGDSSEFFANFSAPRLMIFGDSDNYIPLERAQQMISDFSGSESVVIEGVGHMSFIEDESRALLELTSFIERNKID